ncbi:MAG: SCO family protein [Phycisphaerales bacterium]
MAKNPSYPIVLIALAIGGGVAGLLIGRAIAPSAAPIPANEPTSDGTPPPPSDNPYARFSVADFELTDQDGQPVTQQLFDGEVTVLTFFFASCPDPCPAIQRVMSDVQTRTQGTGVRLASVSVDGEHDTPEVIRNYGLGYDASFDRWAFITGDPADVSTLVRDSLSFNLTDREDQTVTRSDGTTRAQILHPTRLILVGPDRKVIGLYAYNDPDAVDELVAAARAAAG